MKYCFSGTGNSQWVADKLEGLIADKEDMFGMIFPVYAWGLPKVVEAYLKEHIEDIKRANYVYAVMTCGDDIGYADKILNDVLEGKLDAVFSVHMPNTYVCLPGFDVDKDEVAHRKAKETLSRLPEIAETIKKREKKTDVCRGGMPWIKTHVLRPLFNKYLLTDKYFFTTKACTHCKKCVRGCPLENITMDEQRNVVWKHENCTGCLRCFHRCKENVIQFGRFTKNKGQNIHDFDR